MSKINTTLCKLKKADIKNFESALRKQVKKPKYMCEKCVRVSKDKNLLCNPKKIKS